jgi:hypothetical protein
MKAGQIARLELLLQLRARAKGSVKSHSQVNQTWDKVAGPDFQSVGSHSTGTDFQAYALALPGLEVQEVRVDPVGNQVFALASLDLTHARVALCQTGALLREKIATTLTLPRATSWNECLCQVREARLLVDQWTAWEDTRLLLLAVDSLCPFPGPSSHQVQAITSRASLAVSILETLDLPSGLVAGLHDWRAQRGLIGPSPLSLRLEPSATTEWSRVMDLERIRTRWTIVLATSLGERVAFWTFEGQAVGATRPEAMLNLTRIMLPRAQEALDRWFGFPSPLTSSKEAS